MQAPLESTTKSCSLGCKLPPIHFWRGGKLSDSYTISITAVAPYPPPSDKVAETILIVLTLDSPATPVRHRVEWNHNLFHVLISYYP